MDGKTENSSAYGLLIDTMLALGYENNKNVRGAPFDWRKGPHEFGDDFERLKALIEETFAINDNTSVHLVALSEGCPFITLFLNTMPQSWKDRYVSSVIHLSGVWLGSPMALIEVMLLLNLSSYKGDQVPIETTLKLREVRISTTIPFISALIGSITGDSELWCHVLDTTVP